VLDGRLREVRMEHWATSERSLGDVGEPLIRSASDNGDSLVVELEGVLVHIALRGGFVVAQAAADDEETAQAALRSLRERLPAPEPVARHDVPVAFWTYTPNGPMPSLRPIAVPEWDEISENYATATRAALEPIMRGFKPAHGRSAHPLARRGRHREDVRAPRARVGVARLVPAALHRRPRHVLR